MPHTDQKYIDALIEGDQLLIKEIYHKYAPQCKRLVLKNGGSEDDAKDVFQEALIAVSLRAQSKYIILTAPFGAYLYRVYRNKWIDWVKKSDSNGIRFKDLEGYISIANDEENYKEVKYQIYKACFEKLQSACKTMLLMRFKGMKSKPIAEELNLTPNHVDQKMHACRKILKDCCKKHPLFKDLYN